MPKFDELKGILSGLYFEANFKHQIPQKDLYLYIGSFLNKGDKGAIKRVVNSMIDLNLIKCVLGSYYFTNQGLKLINAPENTANGQN